MVRAAPGALAAALTVAACGAPSRPTVAVARAWEVMGTIVTVAAWGPDSAALATAVGGTIDSLRLVDSLLSTYRDDSEISRLNRAAGGPAVVVSPTFAAVLGAALHTARRSGGAFDPTAGRWRAVAWDSLRRAVRLPSGATLDFGGIAKGYALDRAARALETTADSAVLSLGGQLLVLRGRPGRPVGIAEPQNPLTLLAVLEGPAGTFSVSTSSQAEQRDHIRDPRTGRPAGRAQSVTVIAASGMQADAWSTALFVLGCDSAVALAEREGGLDVLCADGDVRWTRGLDGRVALPTASPPPGPAR